MPTNYLLFSAPPSVITGQVQSAMMNPVAPEFQPRPRLPRPIQQRVLESTKHASESFERSVKSLEVMVEKFPVRTGDSYGKHKIPMFGGKSDEYPLFIHTFRDHINKTITDKSLKLNLLIQHCEAEARDAIKSFVWLGDSIGYDTLLNTLAQRLGRPNIVMESCLKFLLNGPPLKANGGKLLLNLTSEMRSCSLTLSSLVYITNIHNTGNILKLMHRLPHHL